MFGIPKVCGAWYLGPLPRIKVRAGKGALRTADLTQRNWRGLDALELAKFEGHTAVEEAPWSLLGPRM